MLTVPVRLNNTTETRVTQLAEKHLQSAHGLLLELCAEQKTGFDAFYRTQLEEGVVRSPSDADKVTPKKTWRAVTARKQLLTVSSTGTSSSSNSGKDAGHHSRSRSPSPHATPVRPGAAATTAVSEPVELLLHRSSIKVWNHKRHSVLSAVMHVEVIKILYLSD